MGQWELVLKAWHLSLGAFSPPLPPTLAPWVLPALLFPCPNCYCPPPWQGSEHRCKRGWGHKLVASQGYSLVGCSAHQADNPAAPSVGDWPEPPLAT